MSPDIQFICVQVVRDVVRVRTQDASGPGNTSSNIVVSAHPSSRVQIVGAFPVGRGDGTEIINTTAPTDAEASAFVDSLALVF